jgi:prepilin-type N-terminal cleavage/methylation domain-containing protein
MKIGLIKNNKGFSFVELLVVIAIISTSMVFIFDLIIRNTQAQKINKDFLVASMLAQEGLELARNSRDENWLLEQAGSPGVAVNVWDGIIHQTNNDFSIGYDDNNIPRDVDFITAAGAQLFMTTSGFYTHDSAGTIPTPFYRIIEVFPGIGGVDPDYDYVRIVSTVQWTLHGHPHSYVAETLLYDWR